MSSFEVLLEVLNLGVQGNPKNVDLLQVLVPDLFPKLFVLLPGIGFSLLGREGGREGGRERIKLSGIMLVGVGVGVGVGGCGWVGVGGYGCVYGCG